MTEVKRHPWPVHGKLIARPKKPTNYHRVPRTCPSCGHVTVYPVSLVVPLPLNPTCLHCGAANP